MTEGDRQFWTVTPDGLRLHLKVTPRGGRDAIDGVAVDADGRPYLRVRVAAPPAEGAANAAVIRLLSKSLSLPRSRLRLTAGANARMKTVMAEGDPESLESSIRAIAAD